MDVLTTRRPRLRPRGVRRARVASLVGVAVAFVLATPACYTLVQHPGIARQNYARPPKNAACTSCHASTALRGYLKPKALASEAPAWERLNHPWWYDTHIAADSARVDSTGAGGSR